MRRGIQSLMCCVLLLTGVACAPESPTAFVQGNVPLDGECVASEDTEKLFLSGTYDVSPGSDGSCDVPYRLALLVSSFLRSNSDTDLGRAEPNILRVHSAEVKLMNLQRQTLLFEEAQLPNPFLVTTGGILEPSSGTEPANGIAFVEVIPIAYAPYLGDFVNDQILAEVQLFGTTTGDVDVDFQPWVYPVDICDGCLTFCASVFSQAEMGGPSLDEFTEGTCRDNAGADDRICVDSGC